MNLIPDRNTPTGRVWAQIMGDARKVSDKPRRKARFTGDHSQKKAWAREMSAGPGIFFPTGNIPNWLNVRMHYRAKAAKAKSQRETSYMEVLASDIDNIAPPIMVEITRYGPKVLDDDGLSASLKHYRDGIADALAIDDGDIDRLRFVNQQELSPKAGFYGIRIEIWVFDETAKPALPAVKVLRQLPSYPRCTAPRSEGVTTKQHPEGGRA